MSMLAEPRRKQKWSVDPRNSTWSNDESKFGQKMLERMGWSKGKGLGRSEQGATEHIKVKVKNNSLGLGTSVNNEDNWIAHQDDFNQLLAELNNCHGQNSTEEPTQDQAQGFSLEEKSKTSKKRVHYMKFTKGKDLSSRSETDLACIFGKRSKQPRDQDEASSDAEFQETKEVNSSEIKSISNPEAELNTVTSTLTMQEYFAQRMAQLKKSRGGNQSTASLQETSSSSQSPAATPESTENTPNTSDTEESQTKEKRKKHRKREQVEDGEKVEEFEDSLVIEEQADSKKKKKKKKNKQDVREEDRAEERSTLTVETDTAGDTVVLSTEKKKKKKKIKDKETPTDTPSESTNQHDLEEKVMNTDSLVKKRKRREDVEERSEEVVLEKKPKKDKKKKKNKN
ncbi:PIN2/TERF1-interacting telomerase inhibitor 1 [Trichomycterus rosablanca]|uniref:PIN2/TERF1-interacting telomerase inhibitor 1 n=1 Tax=Trichomycterus rosablanca TaxID=2290929 RepID=UPI002F350D0E